MISRSLTSKNFYLSKYFPRFKLCNLLTLWPFITLMFCWFKISTDWPWMGIDSFPSHRDSARMTNWILIGHIGTQIPSDGLCVVSCKSLRITPELTQPSALEPDGLRSLKAFTTSADMYLHLKFCDSHLNHLQKTAWFNEKGSD